MEDEQAAAAAAATPSATGSTADGATAAKPPPRRPCPFCLELIRQNARKCPHCQEVLDPVLAAAKQPPRTSRLAVASLVLGLLSPLFLCLPGPAAVVMGVVALVTTRGPGTRGRGLAVAGILLGLLWTIVLVAAVGGLAVGLREGWRIPGGMELEPAF